MANEEDFYDRSWSAIQQLLGITHEVTERLKTALPLDINYFCHHDEVKDDFTIMILVGHPRFELRIWVTPLHKAPEPKEVYPPDCVAIGTLQIYSDQPLELCCSGNHWLVHDAGRWVPLSDSYLAYLIGRMRPCGEPPTG